MPTTLSIVAAPIKPLLLLFYSALSLRFSFDDLTFDEETLVFSVLESL